MTEQVMNRYNGCIEDWKIRLALSRMKAMGLPPNLWPDALQQLAVAITQFRFDPERASGAKESTALCALINHRLTTMLRVEQRERERVARYRESLGLTGRRNGEQLIAQDDASELRLDVQMAVAALPTTERDVCARLMRGHTIRRIAADLGCSWRAARRVVEHIRARFEHVGLDGWVRG